METKYRYIAVGKHYFCLEQSVVLLACTFVAGHGRARLAALKLTASTVLAAIIKIILYRLRLRRRAQLLELPFFGNVCRRVHGGHKIFNLRRAVVIKSLSAQLAHDEVEREIATTVARGRLNFAPTVTRYSVAQRWYEEDYVLGDPGAAFYGAQNAEFWARFHGEIVPILEQILRIEPPAPVRLGDYVDGLMSRLKTALERPQRAPGVGALVLKFAAEYLEDDLRAAADEIVLTTFSHGDLGTGNILRTNDRAIVIDWEAAGRRSILFDLYTYLFSEVHKRHVKTLPDEELDQAIRALQSMLSRAPSRPMDVTRMADIYRRLFYLERLLILAERNLSDKRFSRVVMRSIEVFSQYETKPADRTPVDGRHDNTKGAGIHEHTDDRGSKYATMIVVGALVSLAAEPALASWAECGTLRVASCVSPVGFESAIAAKTCHAQAVQRV